MKFFVLIAFVAVVAIAAAADDCTPLRCQLPLKEGDCTESLPRFYFDNSAKKCKPFTYTGCGGNVNNFRNLQLCENTCLKECSPTPATTTTTRQPTTTTRQTTTTTRQSGTTTKNPSGGPAKPARCTLKLDTGSCKDHEVTRYYFDTAANECKEFTWTGCSANVNNFRSKELCEETCLA